MFWIGLGPNYPGKICMTFKKFFGLLPGGLKLVRRVVISHPSFCCNSTSFQILLDCLLLCVQKISTKPKIGVLINQLLLAAVINAADPSNITADGIESGPTSRDEVFFKRARMSRRAVPSSLYLVDAVAVRSVWSSFRCMGQ